MPHCDPAPPHPQPGEIYNALCPPSWGDVAILVFLMAVMAGLIWYSTVVLVSGSGGGDD